MNRALLRKPRRRALWPPQSPVLHRPGKLSGQPGCPLRGERLELERQRGESDTAGGPIMPFPKMRLGAAVMVASTDGVEALGHLILKHEPA